jgi:hypothetical protein
MKPMMMVVMIVIIITSQKIFQCAMVPSYFSGNFAFRASETVF